MSVGAGRRASRARRWIGRQAVLVLPVVLVLGGSSAGSARTSVSALTLSLRAPQRADVAIARVDLAPLARRRGRRAPRPASLRASLRTGPGFDYVGVLALPARGRLRSLVVVTVNRRPAGSLAPDLARVVLAVGGAGRAHPVVTEAVDPLRARQHRSVVPPATKLCGLRPATIAAGRTLLVAGSPFGYTPQAVARRGLDAACGRALDPAFNAALDVGQTCLTGTAGGQAPCGPGPPPCTATALPCGGPAPCTGPQACCPPCGPLPPVTAATAIVCPLAARPAFACPAAASTTGGAISRSAG